MGSAVGHLRTAWRLYQSDDPRETQVAVAIVAIVGGWFAYQTGALGRLWTRWRSGESA